jgi:hypothetical protein
MRQRKTGPLPGFFPAMDGGMPKMQEHFSAGAWMADMPQNES